MPSWTRSAMPTVTVNVAENLPGGPEVSASFDLAANVVTEVIFAGNASPDRPINSETMSEVEVVVHSGTAPVWWTTNGSDPVVRGSRSFVIPTAPAADVRRPATTLPTVVRLLSTAAAVVTVQRVR